MSGVIQTVQDGINYVADTISGQGHEASAAANKNVVKSDSATAGQKLDAGTNYVSDKFNQKKDEASAEANKQKVQNA